MVYFATSCVFFALAAIQFGLHLFSDLGALTHTPKPSYHKDSERQPLLGKQEPSGSVAEIDKQQPTNVSRSFDTKLCLKCPKCPSRTRTAKNHSLLSPAGSVSAV